MPSAELIAETGKAAPWANKRHEMFNAKSFFQNLNGQPKSICRFLCGVTPSGVRFRFPSCLIQTRTGKESTKQKPATQSGYANVPTAAQRAGDFSDYTDGNGVPFTLTDPTTGKPHPPPRHPHV